MVPEIRCGVLSADIPYKEDDGDEFEETLDEVSILQLCNSLCDSLREIIELSHGTIEHIFRKVYM